MSNDVEIWSRRRRVVMLVMASAFLVWQLPYMDAFDRLAGPDAGMKTVVSLIGFLVWTAGLVGIFVSSRALAGRAPPGVRTALEDELVRANRAKAFTVGYAAALLAAGVMFAVSMFRPVSGADAAHTILIVGVVAPMYAFAVLERVNA